MLSGATTMTAMGVGPQGPLIRDFPFCPGVASSFNEWGEMVAWPASRTRTAQAATEVQIFIDALWAGLVTPFSAFLNAVLTH